VDSSTISDPRFVKLTLTTHQQIVDDSVSNLSLDDSSLVEDNNTQHSFSESSLVEDYFTNPMVANNMVIDSPINPLSVFHLLRRIIPHMICWLVIL